MLGHARMLGHGLPTVPLGLTGGLLFAWETFGRHRGTVGRPCPNECAQPGREMMRR